MASRTKPQKLEPVAMATLAVGMAHVLAAGAVWAWWSFKPLEWMRKPLGGDEPDAGRYWFSPADYRREPVSPDAQEATGTLQQPQPPPAVSAPAVKTAPKKQELSLASAREGLLAEGKVLEAKPADAPLSAPRRHSAKIITLSPVIEVGTKTIPAGRPSRPPVTMMDMLQLEKVEDAARRAAGGADMDPVLQALEAGLKEHWSPPALEDVPVLQRDVRMMVAIAPDGSLIESRVEKPSGSEAMDQSVRAALMALKKISKSLPSSFPKDRYNVEVNFHIE